MEIKINKIQDFLNNSDNKTKDISFVTNMLNELNDIFAHNILITDEMISTFQTHIQSMDSQEFDFNFFYKYLLMKTNSTNNTNNPEICLSQTAPTVNQKHT